MSEWQGIILLLYTSYVLTKCYELKCPDAGYWSKRAKWFCQEKKHYHCLFDVNFNIARELCLKEDYIPEGFKSIFSGSRDAIKCSEERFSPVVSWTNEEYKCIYQKSLCSEEGQIICNSGSSKEDVACRCDHVSGYTFVTVPKHKYFCSPQKEDCSCVKKECQHGYILSKEYVCERGENTIVEPGCPAAFVQSRNKIYTEVDNNVADFPSISFTYTSTLSYTPAICVSILSIIIAIILLKASFPKAAKCINCERHQEFSVVSKSVLESSFFPRMQQTLEEKSFLILKGRKGTGKSTIGNVFQEIYANDEYEIMNITHADHEALKLMKESSSKYFIFVDDICNSSNGTKLFEAIVRILQFNMNTGLKIIVTMEYLYPELDAIIQNSDYLLISSELIFDLDEEGFYSIKDRENILKAHMTENNVYLEKSAASNSKPFKRVCVISLELFNAMLKEEPFLGFPWMCASFCQHEDHIKLGLQFFKQPPLQLIDNINKMRDDGSSDSLKAYQYCILVTILLCKKNTFVIENFKTIPLQDVLRATYKFKEVSRDLIRETVRGLIPIYLKFCGSEVTFSRSEVRQAVLLSYHKLCPKDVLEKCLVSDILAYMRPNDYTPLKNEAVLFVDASVKKEFSKRVANSISDNNQAVKTITDRLAMYTDMYPQSKFLLQVVENLKKSLPGNYKARTVFFRSLGSLVRRNKSANEEINVFNLSWEYVSAKLEKDETFLDNIIQQLQNQEIELQFLTEIVDKFKNTQLHYFIIWNGEKEHKMVAAFVEKLGKQSQDVALRDADKLLKSKNNDKHSALHLAVYLGRDRFFSILQKAAMLFESSGKPLIEWKEIKSIAEKRQKDFQSRLKISFETGLIPRNTSVTISEIKCFENIKVLLDSTNGAHESSKKGKLMKNENTTHNSKTKRKR